MAAEVEFQTGRARQAKPVEADHLAQVGQTSPTDDSHMDTVDAGQLLEHPGSPGAGRPTRMGPTAVPS